MKLNKLTYVLSLALAVGAASCSNDNEWDEVANSSAVTQVGFDVASVSVKENRGVVQIPIVCTGEQNGRVSIEVKVEAADLVEDSEAAVEGTHFIVTSKSINIGSETQQSFVEIKTIDNEEINFPRMFNLTITEAKGAAINASKTCVVTLKDNDALFYDKLQGDFVWKHENPFTGKSEQFDVKIVGFDETDKEYEKVLYVMGFWGYSFVEAQLNYYFDPVTKDGYLELPFGSVACTEAGSDDAGNVFDLVWAGYSGGNPVIKGGLKATWSDDLNTITFETNKYCMAWWYNSTIGYDGMFNGFYNAVAERKKSQE